MRYGEGTITYGHGGTYTGEWQDSENGQGTWTYADGSTYTGEFKDGMRHGEGTMTWPNGDTYTGEWQDSENGQGTWTYADDSTYTGEWKDGQRHGQGTMTYADGHKYTGEWQDDEPVSLSELKLEPILIQLGDLPSGVSGAQVRDTAPATFDAVPDAENTIYQQFEKNGDTIGGVTVFLYEDALMVENAYSAVFSGMDTISETISKLGDKASISHLTVGPGHDLVFTRCSFVVHIRMTTNNPAVEIISYAKRLDRRLRDAVCR